MKPLKDGFPVIATAYVVVVALALLFYYWPIGVGWLVVCTIVYFAARWKWGRTRVHDFLNRGTDEPAPWC